MKKTELFSRIFNFIALLEAMALTTLFASGYHSSKVIPSMRYSLVVIFIIGAVIFAVLFILQRFPRLYPFPVKITAKNMARQAELSKIFLSLLCALVTGLMISLFYTQYCKVLYTPKVLPHYVGIINIALFSLSAACILAYLIAARKKTD